jgi:dTDP-4-dehydrorhamnose reductase
MEWTNKTVLVTGSTGRLGKEVITVLKEITFLLHPTREELDITKGEQVFLYIKENQPDIIIHLAALVSIRKCEEDRELAWKTNVSGTKNLLDACVAFKKQCYFVYMSTPCVFSGENGPYNELSIPYPKHFYGLTKLVAETLLLASPLEKKIILRANFAPKERWQYPKAFVDRYSTYLFADDVARAIKEVIEKDVTGILHIIGDKVLSMYELAKLTTPDIQPMTMADYNGPPLTVDMRLDTIYNEWKKFKISSPNEKKK